MIQDKVPCMTIGCKLLGDFIDTSAMHSSVVSGVLHRRGDMCVWTTDGRRNGNYPGAVEEYAVRKCRRGKQI